MTFSFTESEANVKGGVEQFRVTQSEGAKIHRMAKPRDPAVTEYVRWRIRLLLESKEMTGVQIAEATGLSPAMISSIGKLGVGGRSIDKFAKLLKFKDADEMRRTAYEWWAEQNPKTSSRLEDSAVATAVASVRTLYPLMTEGEIRTILHRFSDPAFDGRDEDFWLKALLEEVKQDHLRRQREKVAKLDEANAKQRNASKVEAAFREAGAIKARLEENKAVEELEKPAESSPPAPRKSAHVPKRQRRHA